MRIILPSGATESAGAAEFLDAPDVDAGWRTIDVVPALGTLPPRSLPKRGWATYILVMDDGRLYVGHTGRPRIRMWEHARTPKWSHVVAVTVRLVPSEFEARAMEFDLHRDFDSDPGLVSTITVRDRHRVGQLSREVLAARALRGGFHR